MSHLELEKRIRGKKAKVGVVGLGYVGLPLAMAFARKGFSVIGLDVDRQKVARLSRGESYILDVPSQDVRAAVEAKRFRATTNFSALSAIDAVILCVPTPLSKTKEPDISHVIRATEEVAKHLRKGQLVVLESTTYPGTTEEVMLPLLEKSGLRVEKDFYLAFSPERVDPGNREFDTVSIPKVVGGVGPFSLGAARVLYSSVVRRVVEVSSAKTAEMTKLLENTFRSVNIGLINEIAVLSNRMGIDIWEVIEAAKTKPFGFMPFYPGPGIGGHCLPIDPLYLSWKSRTDGYEAKMIDLASSVNEAMPSYIAERIGHLLNRKQRAIKNSRVLVLGVAYKRDIDDIRESPALDVIARLIQEGAELRYSDPYVPRITVSGKTFASQALTGPLLKSQHCTVILTDHRSFDYEKIMKHAGLLFDTRNTLRKFSPRKDLYFL